MYYLGVDVGYSNLKVAGGLSEGLNVHVRRPTGAGPVSEMAESIGGGGRYAKASALKCAASSGLLGLSHPASTLHVERYTLVTRRRLFIRHWLRQDLGTQLRIESFD